MMLRFSCSKHADGSPPFFTHFPIVLTIVIAVVELCTADDGGLSRSFLKSIVTLHCLLGLFLIGAFFSGLSASDVSDKTFVVPDAAIALHYQLGRITFFLGIAFAGSGVFFYEALHADFLLKCTYRITLAALIVLGGITGYFGGDLVFKHGAGIELESVQFGPEHRLPPIHTDKK